METTPWGIAAGEYDSRIWLNPYNGIFISKDLGNTWVPFGLSGRGITDIEYANGKIYATTYYFQDGIAGLFISKDAGNTWFHVGENISAANVSASGDAVLLGTYSHGAWLSLDGGITWEQKLGDGFHGPKILATAASADSLIVSSSASTYNSTDDGNTWSEIPTLSGLSINNIEMISDIMFAGTENGLYKSVDKGQTWEKVESWGNKSVGQILFFEKVLYASGTNIQTQKEDVFRSADLGTTWKSTQFTPLYDAGNIMCLTSAFTQPSLLFACVPGEGIYEYGIAEEEITADPFLEIPWDAKYAGELIERIYSYFDHEYPLANYVSHSEPGDTINSIVNFFGIRKNNTDMYYSGHDGYDFALAHGTQVLAAATGEATYTWSPTTGHTVTIAHENGYKTIYGHLQSSGLITTSAPVWVEQGATVGHVGVTGQTTGPHLHFSVEKNTPIEKTDPFGWQTDASADPWEKYIWEDPQGTHTGTSSKYLWNSFPEKAARYIDHNGSEVILNNKKIIIDQNSSDQNFTIFVEPYEFPAVPIQQNKLVYITGTSVLINIYNILGQKTPSLLKPVKIEMDVSNANLDDVWANTMRFYFWNESTQMWEESTSVFDVATKRLTGETYHFSHIAAFGEKKTGWTDTITVTNTTFALK